MSLTHLPLEQINEGYLAALIDSKSQETQFIEYKRDAYGGKDSERAEFLADVSSFANAGGGDILIGLDARNGVPTKIVPFTGSTDGEILRLEQMARSGIEPRIFNVQMKAVPIAAGGHVLIIRVPRSYQQPHRVIFAGKNRFWGRSSAGKYEPSVEELRILFTFAPQLSERIREFRLYRTSQIAAGESPAQLLDIPVLAIHIVPFGHFVSRPIVSLDTIAKDARMFPPIGASARQDWFVNLDGFVTLSNAAKDAERHRAYVQVFRSGAVEAVSSSIGKGSLDVDVRDLERTIVHHVGLYVDTLHRLGVETPAAVMASLLGVKGTRLTSGRQAFSGEMHGNRVTHQQIHYGEIVLEQIPQSRQEYATVLKPMLDQIANSAGAMGALSFDETGKYLF